MNFFKKEKVTKLDFCLVLLYFWESVNFNLDLFTASAFFDNPISFLRSLGLDFFYSLFGNRRYLHPYWQVLSNFIVVFPV